jgi:hypothetical protein
MDPLLRAFQGIHKQAVIIESATVRAVQDDGYSISVVDNEGNVIPDVRLKASMPIMGVDKEYAVIVPRPGSTVLIGLMNNDTTAAYYVVLSVSEYDKIEIKNEQDEFSIVQEKEVLTIKNKLQKIEFFQDIINIQAGGENKTWISLQDDKILMQAKGGKFTMTSQTGSLMAVLQAISDAFTGLNKATCPPNAPLVTAPCAADFAKVTTEINKFLQ